MFPLEQEVACWPSEAMEHIAELGCYSGCALSALIAWRLLRMKNLTWVNKMFLVYFCIDAVFGSFETYFLFKLYRERFLN